MGFIILLTQGPQMWVADLLESSQNVLRGPPASESTGMLDQIFGAGAQDSAFFPLPWWLWPTAELQEHL